MTIPHIYKYFRSASGLRVWFDGPELGDRRFVYTIKGTTVILEERPSDMLLGNVVRNYKTMEKGTVGVWTAPLLGGPEWGRKNLHIAGITAFGDFGEPDLLTYQIPDISDLTERPSKRGSVYQPTRAQLAARQSMKPQKSEALPLPSLHVEWKLDQELGPPGSTNGSVVATSDYLFSLLKAIVQAERVTDHRLLKVDGVWIWRAPDIRFE